MLRFYAVASLEWTYRFKRPVYPGDRIQGRIRVLDVRPTSKPDRGIVRLNVEVINQHGEVVQEGQNTLMVVA